jgi:hypothetical protein
VWYETSDRHAERGAYEWFIYDPTDLAMVATGVKKMWEIQPKTHFLDDGRLTVDSGGYSGDGLFQVGGITFDETTRRLYGLVTTDPPRWGCCESSPRVYVYQVG